MVQGVPLRKQQPARKKGRVSVGGGHISWDPGVRRGTIGHVVLRTGAQEKGESLRGRIQEGVNKPQAVA